jgi:hypothetical protein
VDAGGNLDRDDQSDHPVDGGAEWRPPPSAGNILAALLPSVLEPVGREPQREEPRRPGDARRGDTTNAIATPLSTAMTLHLPSATAKPI